MDLEHAIAHRLQVTFNYDGHSRTVQPAAYGPHRTTQRLSLRGYQVGGTSSSAAPPFWRLFTVDQMTDLLVTTEAFAENPPGYATGDRHIDSIIELPAG